MSFFDAAFKRLRARQQAVTTLAKTPAATIAPLTDGRPRKPKGPVRTVMDRARGTLG